VTTSQTKKAQDCDEATLKTCFLVYQGVQEQIRFADTKAAFITALNAVLFGFLASNFQAIKAVLAAHQSSNAIIIPVAVFGLYVLATGLSVGLLITAVMSRFAELAPQSKVFFGHIIRTYGKDCGKYTADIQAMKDADWIKDVGGQIIEVSHIALTKHRMVRRAAQATLGAFVLWVLAFVVLLTMQ
jgi:hypothetical protein